MKFRFRHIITLGIQELGYNDYRYATFSVDSNSPICPYTAYKEVKEILYEEICKLKWNEVKISFIGHMVTLLEEDVEYELVDL